MSEPIIERFWNRVDKNGPKPEHMPSLGNCWLWTSTKNPYGYGIIHFGKKTWVASRFSWVIHNGEIPPGILICHHCDNPACVNPDHLFSGTPLDNIRDMFRKGRDKSSRKKTKYPPDPLMPKPVFAALFYCWRKTHNKTLQEFATELGVSVPNLWRLEHGKQIDGVAMTKLILWLLGN